MWTYNPVRLFLRLAVGACLSLAVAFAFTHSCGTSETPKGRAAKAVEKRIHLNRVVVQPNRIELGILGPGASTTTVLSLTNVSDQDVQIVGWDSSCECTRIKFERGDLKPGEIAIVDFITEIESDSRFTGELLITVQVHVADARSKLETLGITACATVVAADERERNR